MEHPNFRMLRLPERVEGERGPEANHRVGDQHAGEEVHAEAREDDECGVETCALGGLLAGVGEEAAGEGFAEKGKDQHGERERDAGGCGESARAGGPDELEGFHAGGHRPVEERCFFEVADAVGVERDEVVAEEHLAGDLGVDGVGVVEQRWCDEGEAGVEDRPQRKDGQEGAARAGWDGGHWG